MAKSRASQPSLLWMKVNSRQVRLEPTDGKDEMPNNAVNSIDMVPGNKIVSVSPPQKNIKGLTFK